MNGPPDATAVSRDTHPWALRAGPAPAVLRKLLEGAVPVCFECRQEIAAGEPKIAHRLTPSSRMTFWRCGDCEYRSTRP